MIMVCNISDYFISKLLDFFSPNVVSYSHNPTFLFCRFWTFDKVCNTFRCFFFCKMIRISDSWIFKVFVFWFLYFGFLYFHLMKCSSSGNVSRVGKNATLSRSSFSVKESVPYFRLVWSHKVVVSYGLGIFLEFFFELRTFAYLIFVADAADIVRGEFLCHVEKF